MPTVCPNCQGQRHECLLIPGDDFLLCLDCGKHFNSHGDLKDASPEFVANTKGRARQAGQETIDNLNNPA